MNGVWCKKRYVGGRMSQASAWSLPAAVTRRTVETRAIGHLGHRSGPAATPHMLHVRLSSVTPYQLPYCHFPLQQLVARRCVNVQFVSRASPLPLLPPHTPPGPPPGSPTLTGLSLLPAMFPSQSINHTLFATAGGGVCCFIFHPSD